MKIFYFNFHHFHSSFFYVQIEYTLKQAPGNTADVWRNVSLFKVMCQLMNPQLKNHLDNV